jgi:hypothetical protein
LSKPYTVTCPHCLQDVTIPYESLSHHFHTELGRRSVTKRKDLHEHLTSIRNRRWKKYVHPKQKALLVLAKKEDLKSLSPAAIADKIGLTGEHRGRIVSNLIKRLQDKGLLPPDVRWNYHARRDAVLQLAQREDITTMSAEEIADKVGFTGPHRKRYVWNSIIRLRRKGLLP